MLAEKGFEGPEAWADASVRCNEAVAGEAGGSQGQREDERQEAVMEGAQDGEQQRRRLGPSG